MKRRFLSSLFASILSLLLLAANASADETFILNPLVDVFSCATGGLGGGSVYNNEVELHATNYAYKENTYLKFDLSGINDNSVITSAKLRLYEPYEFNKTGTYPNDVAVYYSSNDNWNNSTSFAGLPAISGSIIDRKTYPANYNNWMEWNLSSKDLSQDLKDNSLTLVLTNMKTSPWNMTIMASSRYPDQTLIPYLEITTSERPTVYGLFVGVKDYAQLTGSNLPTAVLKGDMNAENVFNAFQGNISNFNVTDSILKTSDIRYFVTGMHDYDVQNAINEIKSKMKPQDMFVMYAASHGHKDTNGAYLNLGYAPGSGQLSADELYEYLKVLNDHNKMIFLDACKSGSFVTDGHLEKLNKISFLSSATLNGDAPFNEEVGYLFGYALSEGLKKGKLGYSQADGFERGNPDGELTFDEIRYWIEHWQGISGLYGTTVFYGDFDSSPVIFSEDLWKQAMYKSEDFSGAFSLRSVPEPATMLLFGLGLVGLVGVRKFKK